MNEEGDLSKRLVDEGIEMVKKNCEHLLMILVIYKQQYVAQANILSGTIKKFMQRTSLFSSNLHCLRLAFDKKGALPKIEKYTFILDELGKSHLVGSRYDFFVGMLSLFEDAVSNSLLDELFSKDEIKNMKQENKHIKKILKNADLVSYLETHYSAELKSLRAALPKFNKIPFLCIIEKLKKKSFISQEQCQFLSACIKIRNGIHNNGEFKPLSKDECHIMSKVGNIEFANGDKEITIKSSLLWAKEIVKIFEIIVIKTNWQNNSLAD